MFTTLSDLLPFRIAPIVLLILSLVFISACDDDVLTEDDYLPFSAQPYFDGNILGVPVKAQLNSQGWKYSQTKTLEQISNSKKSNLIYQSQLFNSEESSCGTNCIFTDILLQLTVEYKFPFVDDVLPLLSNSIQMGPKSFQRGSQEGFNLYVSVGDTLKSLPRTPITAFTKYGEQVDSRIEVLRYNERFNYEEQATEYEVLIKVDAHLYEKDNQNVSVGLVEGEFLLRFLQ